jgi:hypothetical protein
MKFKDINDKELSNGDIIDIRQTVNGQNLFVILDIETLDLRYLHDLNYKYQYDVKSLLEPNHFHGDTEWIIVGNIKNMEQTAISVIMEQCKAEQITDAELGKWVRTAIYMLHEQEREQLCKIIQGNMEIINYDIRTSSGELTSFGDQLSFLTQEETSEFNNIGYSGKNLAGQKITREEFLNSIRPHEKFKVKQTKFDNGDFNEAFTITRVVMNGSKR